MRRGSGAAFIFNISLALLATAALAASPKAGLHEKSELHGHHARHAAHVAREREKDHVVYALPEATHGPARLSALAGNDREAWSSARRLRPIAWHKRPKLPRH